MRAPSKASHTLIGASQWTLSPLRVEERVLSDTRADDQIAPRPAERAGVALTRHTELRAGVDAGGRP